MNFEITPRLLRSGIPLLKHEGCHILLKNDINFPWFIIVPEVEASQVDLHQLEDARLTQVMKVMKTTSSFVEKYFTPDKLNTGCIGNQVEQMHIHVIGRNASDPAWPGVVWGFEVIKEPYAADQIDSIKTALLEHFASQG